MRVLERREVRISELKPPLYEIRDYAGRLKRLERFGELLESTGGPLYPILVRKLPDGTLRVVDGWTRVCAWSRRGHEAIKADICEMTDEEELRAQFQGNQARRRNTPYEAAKWFAKVMEERGWGVEEVARAVGVSAKYVKRVLALVELEKLGFPVSLLKSMSCEQAATLLSAAGGDRERARSLAGRLSEMGRVPKPSELKKLLAKPREEKRERRAEERAERADCPACGQAAPRPALRSAFVKHFGRSFEEVLLEQAWLKREFDRLVSRVGTGPVCYVCKKPFPSFLDKLKHALAEHEEVRGEVGEGWAG